MAATFTGNCTVGNDMDDFTLGTLIFIGATALLVLAGIVFGKLADCRLRRIQKRNKKD